MATCLRRAVQAKLGIRVAKAYLAISGMSCGQPFAGLQEMA